MEETVILGSGMAAWGAYDRLVAEGAAPTVYDRAEHLGGHTASYRTPEGFVFDEGPHISFTRHEEVRQLLDAAVHGEQVEGHAQVDNHFHGHWIKHPAITYLHGLPVDLVTRCLVDFVAAHAAQVGEDGPRPATYREWLLATYGTTFTDTFPSPYGRKYHTLDPSGMDTSWLGPRLVRPSLEDVLAGAVGPPRREHHYIGAFRYPRLGGFQAYLDDFHRRSRPRGGYEAVAIDPSQRLVSFANGEVVRYDQLISTVPLPALIGMLPAPSSVRDAAGRLACSSAVLINLGVDREDLSPAHWRYVYDEDLLPVRISHPHLFSPATVPPGHGAIQVEVYYSDKYRPRDLAVDDHIDRVITDLQRMDILRGDDRIIHRSAWEVPYANVIFDLEREAALSEVNAFLDETGIRRCGRYGDWGYYWTDDSYLSGQRSAQRALDGSTTR